MSYRVVWCGLLCSLRCDVWCVWCMACGLWCVERCGVMLCCVVVVLCCLKWGRVVLCVSGSLEFLRSQVESRRRTSIGGGGLERRGIQALTPTWVLRWIDALVPAPRGSILWPRTKTVTLVEVADPKLRRTPQRASVSAT